MQNPNTDHCGARGGLAGAVTVSCHGRGGQAAAAERPGSPQLGRDGARSIPIQTGWGEPTSGLSSAR